MSDRAGLKESGTARLFFALWPDAATRAQLAEVARQMHTCHGGRCMRDDTLHLTLAFIGDIDATRINDCLRVAARVRSPAFDFDLDHTGFWRHNRIVYLGANTPPAALTQLADALHDALTQAGILPAAQVMRFHPHVTLLRNAACAKTPHDHESTALTPIHWQAREFVLARSSLQADGARYTLAGRWALR